MPIFGQDVTPSTTGLNLGSATNRWDAFLETVTTGVWNNIRVVDGNKYAATSVGLQAAHDALPSTGGVIIVNQPITFSGNVTFTVPVTVFFGADTYALGTSSIIIQKSGSSIVGVGRGHSAIPTTRFTYSGTGAAFQIEETAVVGDGGISHIRLENFAVSATGGATTSATAVGIQARGLRNSDLRMVGVDGFGGGVGIAIQGSTHGFAATNTIYNPWISGNLTGIFTGTQGGNNSTHLTIIGGVVAGSSVTDASQTGIDLDGESNRIIGTDVTDFNVSGQNGLVLRSQADDTAIIGGRFEANWNHINISSGVDQTQIIAPTFITTGNDEIVRNGTNTLVISNDSNVENVLPAGLDIGTGIGGDGGGLKHARITTGSIGTSGGSVTHTWATAFADTNYTVWPSVEDSTAQSETDGLRVAKVRSKAATQVIVDIDNLGAGAITGTLHLLAVHD